MLVTRLASLEELGPIAGPWRSLSRDVPFRGWDWLTAWWRHYGEPHARSGRKELFVLTVTDAENQVIGIAPWYLERSKTLGRIVRFLGSGEVCSDYLSVLCSETHERQVATALATWLVTDAQQDPPTGELDSRWDLLHLAGVAASDAPIAQLLSELDQLGSKVQHCNAPRCWRVALPKSWDEYMAALSKSHRKQIRRLERGDLESGAVSVHQVRTEEQLARGIELLIDLHQRRRQSLGEPGCFSSAQFASFHREVIPQLFAAGQLRLTWLEADGVPLAAEYHVAGDGVVYAYQAGLDPTALEREPGRLAAIATIKAAIEEGATAMDFLRGDEPYKAHWRAEPREMIDVHVVPGRAGARLRHSMYVAGTSVKDWLKTGLELTGLRNS